MNSGAWSFLSVMVMVAVVVPVRPTSLPAMSLAMISNSYVVVGSVWKEKTQKNVQKYAEDIRMLLTIYTDLNIQETVSNITMRLTRSHLSC